MSDDNGEFKGETKATLDIISKQLDKMEAKLDHFCNEVVEIKTTGRVFKWIAGTSFLGGLSAWLAKLF